VEAANRNDTLNKFGNSLDNVAVKWGLISKRRAEDRELFATWRGMFGDGGILDNLIGDGPSAVGTLTGLAKAESEVGTEAVSAATDLKKLADQQEENIEKAFSLEEAQDRVKDSIADLREQIKRQREEHQKGAGSLDANTEAGRRNRESVRGLTRDYQDLIEKTAAEGKSTQGLRDQLEKTLVSMGFSRAEAHRYAAELNKIPDELATKVRLEDEQAKRDARETASELRRMLGGTFTTTLRLNRGNRFGGVYEHAQSGLLREAAMFSPRTPARYAFAEPGTGGEAFVPKHGDYGRSMSILSQAAAWYGARVAPREQGWYGGGGAGGVMVSNTYQLNVTAPVGSHPREIGGEIMRYLRSFENGGGTTWAKA